MKTEAAQSPLKAVNNNNQLHQSKVAVSMINEAKRSLKL
jgi:hypothetical protein